MSLAVSPLAPTGFPEMLGVPGVKIATGNSGGRYRGRDDVLFIQMDEPSAVAGVFTQSQTAAAPVLWCRRALEKGLARSIVVNAGNANAFTGSAGDRLVEATVFAATQMAPDPTPPEQVFIASTGVIGEPLPADMIANALEHIAPKLADSDQPGGWEAAAKAIMTTDTVPKVVSKQITLNGETITITGMSKGAGMINPNMATMLAFVATDVGIETGLLNELLRQAAYRSFNRITIDGDTSTNDSCVIMASGEANIHFSSCTDEGFEIFKAQLISVFEELAKAIVYDGEGATKFVTVDVQGALNQVEALNVAYAVAHSPLVKTALFASDPNWGRIVCAIGYSDISGLDASKVNVWLNDVQIVANGGRAASYREEEGQAIFNQSEFTIGIDLGRGDVKESIWTTDLSHEYVRINAEYRS